MRRYEKVMSVIGVNLLFAALLSGCSDSAGSMQSRGNGDTGATEIAEATELTAETEITEEAEVTEVTAETEITEEAEVTEITDDTGSLSYSEVQEFSYELLKHTMDKRNPVLSPASAYIALSMVGNGAKDETLAQFQNVLSEDLLTTPEDMMNKLPRKEKAVTLTLANSVWIDETVDVNHEWQDKIENAFKADTYNLELSGKKTMKEINKWVEQNTNGLIEEMIDKPLSPDNRLVLFNALYFKADWQSKFGVENTREKEFYLEDGSERKVSMMQEYGENQLYVKNDVAEGIILPYADENIVFMALKPSGDASAMTVREMYESLTWEDISDFLQQEDTTLCNLRLPKFRVEFDESLNDSLINMGLSDAFDPAKADLSGLVKTQGDTNLYISLVRQKALVIVDEEGTEAAAVTEVAVRETAAFLETEPVDIHFDEPFFYMIADKNTRVPLFMGIMDCPEN